MIRNTTVDRQKSPFQHVWKSGEVWWLLSLHFRSPSGDAESGWYRVSIENSFGALSLQEGGSTAPVNTSEQGQWLSQVWAAVLSAKGP